MTIPHTIHHVWPGTDQFRFAHWRQTWMHHHADWSFRFHRLQSTGNQFVDKVLHREDLTVVVKSDLLRWQVLCDHGGIYVDTDVECLRPVTSSWIEHDGVALAPEWPTVNLLSPSIIVAPKNHYILHHVVEELLKVIDRVPADSLNLCPHVYTGPYAVTRILEAFSGFLSFPCWYASHEAAGWLEEVPFVKQHWTGANPDGWQRINRFSDGREVLRA